MAEKEVVEASILFKLFRKGNIGGAHTSLRNAMKGIKEDARALKKAVDEGLFLWLKTRLTICPITKDFCVSPNNSCNNCSLCK